MDDPQHQWAMLLRNEPVLRGKVHKAADIVLARGIPVKCSIKGQNSGEPLPDIYVDCRSFDHHEANIHFKPPSTGTFTFHVLPGEYSLNLSTAPGYLLDGGDNQQFIAKAGEDQAFTYHLKQRAFPVRRRD